MDKAATNAAAPPDVPSGKLRKIRTGGGGGGSVNSKTAGDELAIPADEVCVLIHNAAFFGVAERGLWHYANLGQPLPRRLGRAKDGLSVMSGVAHASTVEAVLAPLPSSHPAAAELRKLPVVTSDRVPSGVTLTVSTTTATQYVYAKVR